MSLEAGQWAALAADLNRAPARIHALAPPVVDQRLHAIEADARDRAAVLTGEMRSRVHTEMDGDGLGGSVIDDSDHAIYNEYGTSKMAAQPFMGPAFEAGAPGLAEALGQVGESAAL